MLPFVSLSRLSIESIVFMFIYLNLYLSVEVVLSHYKWKIVRFLVHVFSYIQGICHFLNKFCFPG